MPTFTLKPSSKSVVLTDAISANDVATLDVVIDAKESATFLDGETYILTIKRWDGIEGTPYVRELLTVTGDRSATVDIDLRLDSLLTAIGASGYLVCWVSVDRSSGGPLGFGKIPVWNTARRDGDVHQDPDVPAASVDELAAVAQRVLAMEDAPPGSGDMQKAIYDPDGIAGDVFDADNQRPGETNTPYTLAEQAKLATGVYPTQTPGNTVTIPAGPYVPDCTGVGTIEAGLAGNMDSFGLPIGMEVGRDVMIRLRLNGWLMPAAPHTAYFQVVGGAWQAVGPVCHILLQRWSNDEYSVSCTSYEAGV